jgi:PAS domain S-box-containing protein
VEENQSQLKHTRSPLLSYGLAVLAVGVMLGIKLLFGSQIGPDTPFLLFLGAVLFAAWYGGLGAGLLATAVAAVAADYFFLSPFFSFGLAPKDLFQVSLFGLEGIGISLLVSSLRAAHRRAEASSAEAVRYQAASRQSQEDFRLLVENVRDYAIFIVDKTGRIESWGIGAASIFGYTDAEIIGQPVSRLFTAEDVENNVPEQEMKQAETAGQAEDERWHLRKDGSHFWASGITTALRDEAGSLRGFSKVARDITGHKQIQEALAVSEERYRIVADSARDAIITIDQESRILFINQAAEQIFGHSLGEMQGESLSMLMPDYLRHLHRAGFERYLSTGQRHLSWESVEVPVFIETAMNFLWRSLSASSNRTASTSSRAFAATSPSASGCKRVSPRSMPSPESSPKRRTWRKRRRRLSVPSAKASAGTWAAYGDFITRRRACAVRKPGIARQLKMKSTRTCAANTRCRPASGCRVRCG